MKMRKYCKLPAILLALILLTVSLGACAKDKTEGSSQPEHKPGDVSGQARGRYTERSVTLPPELAEQSIQHIFAADNVLHLLTMKELDDGICLQEWVCQDGTFTEVTQDWLAGLKLPATDWIEARLAQNSAGEQFLYTGYAQGTDSGFAFIGHLWKGTAEGAADITPEKWTVPNDAELGGYEMIQDLAALDNNTLAVLTLSGMDILSATDGSVLASEPSAAYYEGNIASDGKNVYLCSSDFNGSLIEKRVDGRMDGALTIPFPSKDSSREVMSYGTGSLFVAALKGGALIAMGEDGIFRLPEGAAEDGWEQLLAGIDTDFSTPDCWCRNIAALENGGIYALFMANEEQKLNFYQFDPDAVLEVTQTLKLYTVYESSLLKQAAAMYHKLHPEVLIDIEYEFPLYSADIPDYDTIYKKLNTRLFGEDAPDILIMDHLNMDTYARQGLLQDLEDIIRPLEENGELLSNITGAYRGEDGKRYAVPLLFEFTLALGRDIAPENMRSMEALADFLSRADHGYLGEQTVAGLVDTFYPFFCEKIVHDKQLDRETLGTYLGYLKKIADNSDIVSVRSGDEDAVSVSGMWSLTTKAKLAFEKAQGFTDCMAPMSMVDLIKGDFTAFENSFTPCLQTGISSKSRYSDTARDFLKFALSREVQDHEFSQGFPVNSGSLKAQSQKDNSAIGFYTMIPGEDGSVLEFEGKPFSRETAERLYALCEALDTPTKKDTKIRNTLVECLEDYLKGTRSMEDTIGKIEDSLKMYLAE